MSEPGRSDPEPGRIGRALGSTDRPDPSSAVAGGSADP